MFVVRGCLRGWGAGGGVNQPNYTLRVKGLNPSGQTQSQMVSISAGEVSDQPREVRQVLQRKHVTSRPMVPQARE